MARHPVIEALDRFLHRRTLRPPLSGSDREFLGRFRMIVAQHYSDRGFTTQVAAATVGMSRMHLNRKLRALTGQSTHEFIRSMRLEAACELLKMPLAVESIAESTGFKSSSHFAVVFRQKFGVGPSKYRKIKSLAREPPRRRSPGK
jgi:AraC-like DNA-binding protein